MTTVATFGAVKEKEFSLIETGQYVLTLFELEEATGKWGDRMVWKFLVSPPDDYANYIARDDGNEKSVWAWTDRDIILGSFCQELVEVLTGRKFEKDGEPPSEDDLLGKRCLAFITHETPTTGKSAGKKREKIVEGSLKKFVGPSKKIAPDVRPSSTQVSADPSEDEIDRALLVSKLQKQIARAVKLGTPSHLEWNAYTDDDFAGADLVFLTALSNQVAAENVTALADD